MKRNRRRERFLYLKGSPKNHILFFVSQIKAKRKQVPRKFANGAEPFLLVLLFAPCYRGELWGGVCVWIG